MSKQAREFVVESCRIKGLDLFKPKKGAPEILVYDYRMSPAKCIADAKTWEEAQIQLIAHYTN